MSIRKDLVKTVFKAKDVLGESTELVAEFLKSQINSDGGFRGRSNDSDLYYTVFGLEGLISLCPGFSRDGVGEYLRGFDGKLASMGLVDLACYLRCLADVRGRSFCQKDLYGEVVRGIDGFSTDDMGYSVERSAKKGSAYGCFLALGAFQDVGLDVGYAEGVINCLQSLKTAEGAYVNDPVIQVGSTPATAAAIAVLHYLGGDVGEDTVDWLLKRVGPEGGFPAVENAPVADLLSTATALHALSLVGADIGNLREGCLDFVDTLWDGKGGFCGSVADGTCDCEYTFYGLLALGHLGEK